MIIICSKKYILHMVIHIHSMCACETYNTYTYVYTYMKVYRYIYETIH